jgi:hypothetical protein
MNRIVSLIMSAFSARLRDPKIAHIFRKQIKVEAVWDLSPLSDIHPDVENFDGGNP